MGLRTTRSTGYRSGFGATAGDHRLPEPAPDRRHRYARPISRIVVIGATGHVGTYLVPRLVRAGHEVVALSRGARDPYLPAPEWRRVERVEVDRDAEDAAGTFGERIAALAADAVVDMICFAPESAQQLVDALRPARPLLLHCGTIWVHGPASRVPVTEDEPRTAYGEYGTGKVAIEALLHRETIAGGVPSVVLHPGHISGGPWPVITPAGNLDLDVWRRLAVGEPRRAAGSRARRAPPRPCRRRRTGLRARAQPARSHRIELPCRVRAGHDAARTGRRCRRMVRPRAGTRVRRLVGVRATRRCRARRGDSRPRRPKHRREHRSGSRRARLSAPVQLARRRPRSHFAGSPRTVTSISMARRSEPR